VIRVLILGQPHWARHIAAMLNRHVDDIEASFVPQSAYLGLLRSGRRNGPVVIMRAGYRIGGTTARGRLFDGYWSLLRRAMPAAVPCHYWLGTDVMDTLAEDRAGTLRRKALAAAAGDLHLADAPWLATELATVGLNATVAHVPAAAHAPAVVAALPADFKVLTYIPTARFEFYGGPAILEAARRLPAVHFDIVGGVDRPERSTPANVRWHGWVGDMSDRYDAASVIVRVPRHDGLGNTVVEGLLHAREIVYTYDVPHVRRIWPVTANALTDALAELRDAHLAGRLEPNLAGRAYALEAFDEVRLVGELATALRSRA
jgi:hypothetical protein